MPKFHRFMRCDHKLPNGTASVNDNEWMPVMITGLPEWSKTGPPYYCEECEARVTIECSHKFYDVATFKK